MPSQTLHQYNGITGTIYSSAHEHRRYPLTNKQQSIEVVKNYFYINWSCKTIRFLGTNVQPGKQDTQQSSCAILEKAYSLFHHALWTNLTVVNSVLCNSCQLNILFFFFFAVSKQNTCSFLCTLNKKSTVNSHKYEVNNRDRAEQNKPFFKDFSSNFLLGNFHQQLKGRLIQTADGATTIYILFQKQTEPSFVQKKMAEDKFIIYIRLSKGDELF